MGVVEETGSEVTGLEKGDRVVIPLNISCGHCFMCDHGLMSQCETTQVREYGTGASLLGHTKLYGQVPGGQAEYRERRSGRAAREHIATAKSAVAEYFANRPVPECAIDWDSLDGAVTLRAANGRGGCPRSRSAPIPWRSSLRVTASPVATRSPPSTSAGTRGARRFESSSRLSGMRALPEPLWR